MEKWLLVSKESGRKIEYREGQFKELESQCKKLLGLGQNKWYLVEYHKDKILIETVKMSDYFNE